MRILSRIASVLAALCAIGPSRSSDDRRPKYTAPAVPRRLPQAGSSYRTCYDPVLAERYQAERRERKAREWFRQHKWKGHGSVIARNLPEILEPANQWRRVGDRLLSFETLRANGWRP